MIFCLPKWCRSVGFWLELYLCAMLAICSRQIVAALDERFASVWKAIAEFLASNPAANALTAAALTAAIIALCHTRRLSPIFSPSWVMWSVVAMIYCAAPGVLRVPIAGEFDYSVIAFAGALMLCIIELIKLFPPEKEADLTHPYFMDSPQRFADGRKRFAEAVAHRIHATSGKEAFAVGISGAWGSGKSTFLGYLEATLCRKPDIQLRFLPWNSSSPNAIIGDFFETLANHVAPSSASTRRLLRRYAATLTAGGIGSIAEKIADVSDNIFAKDAGIEDLKERVAELLEQLPGRVYVFIDDMDRLDREEILQVLKLIRNTANFPRITYIVTYDREYIVSTIGADRGRGNDFIEKIFHLEIALPAIEEYVGLKVIWDVVAPLLEKFPDQKQELHRQILLIKGGHKYEHYALSAYITNYRKALRFANVLSNHINYLIEKENGAPTGLKERKGLADLDFRELFWLEVLRYAYPDIYRILDTNRDRILTLSGEGYRLRDDISGIDKDCRWILESLFEDFPRHNSIAHPHNYGHYFALRKFDNHLSESEFEAMLADEAGMEARIKEWFDRRPPVRQSAYFHFSSYDISRCDTDKVLNYFHGLLLWMAKTGDESLIDIFKSQSNAASTGLYGDQQSKASFEAVIAEGLRRIGDAAYAVKLLAGLKPGYVEEEGYWLITNGLDINAYRGMVNVLVERIDQERQIIPEDLFDSMTPICKLLDSTAIIIGQDQNGWNNYDVSGWEVLQEKLVARKSKSNLKELILGFKRRYEIEEEYGYDFEQEAYSDRICRTFGSWNGYRSFCVDNFEGDEEAKKKIYDEFA